jgi:hypothetical protein
MVFWAHLGAVDAAAAAMDSFVLTVGSCDFTLNGSFATHSDDTCIMDDSLLL